jgi:hypothetical protein
MRMTYEETISVHLRHVLPDSTGSNATLFVTTSY